jgi:RimJ/RimL family protein N-acetyltransferase
MAQLVFDQSARIGEWVAQKVNQTASWGDFYALGIESDGGIIAGVVFNNYNGANATCHIAVDRHTRLLPKMIYHSFDYAFNHCGLKRLTGMVPTSEPKTIAFDKHIGFEEEFVMKDGAPGADMMVLVMRPDICRWLRKE